MERLHSRAAYLGHHDVVRWWIVSGREMNLGKPGDIYKTDAIGAAKRQGKTEVVSLLVRFKSDPTKTRSELRLELGINGQFYYSYCYYYCYCHYYSLSSLWLQERTIFSPFSFLAHK